MTEPEAGLRDAAAELRAAILGLADEAEDRANAAAADGNLSAEMMHTGEHAAYLRVLDLLPSRGIR